ncbi:MAG: tetratricopeptide repeat protein [Deltaproteobacteria bacterium]|nr:tetratricopeptide repeat protein [Deltaproteobacteria bacterium]
MRFIVRWAHYLKSSYFRPSPRQQRAGQRRVLAQVEREPESAKAHLRLAESYQRQGEREKAIAEYLRTAEIFGKNNFQAQAVAVYKQVLKQDPTLDEVHLKIAEIYRTMGFLGDAFAEYRALAHRYDDLGIKDRALEMLERMSELDPRKTASKSGFKHTIQWREGEARPQPPEPAPGRVYDWEKKIDFFDLRAELETDRPLEGDRSLEISVLERIHGFEEIFQELQKLSGPTGLDPHFNFNMGVACRELGLVEEAGEQFQLAMERGQSPKEATRLLSLCRKEKGELAEAHRLLEELLGRPDLRPEEILEIKYELGLVLKEEGQQEEALACLRDISAAGRLPGG